MPHEFEYYNTIGEGAFGKIRKCAQIINPFALINANNSPKSEDEFRFTMNKIESKETNETDVSMNEPEV